MFRLSYGTGRPAVLKDDDSIRHGRLLLQHPLAIEDDMRLVSTVELMALRERVHNELSPVEENIREQDFEELRRADLNFRSWYATWDQAFSQKYEDAGQNNHKFPSYNPSGSFPATAFYRQSLQIQHLHAELFHNATALRGINGPEDIQKMPAAQRELAIRSIQIARQGLDITVNSPAYREGMKYGSCSRFHFHQICAKLILNICSRALHARHCNFCCVLPITVGAPIVCRFVFRLCIG